MVGRSVVRDQRNVGMLKGIDPLLNADLLYALRAMGHGDEVVLADTNFPAVTMARRLIRLDGVTGPRTLEAVLSVMPLDEFVDCPCHRIEVVGDPEAEPPVCTEYQQVIDRAEAGRFKLGRIERFAFYERARSAFAVIQTGEQRLYGCVLLTMGVIRPT
jgi:L-fucose mutarotase